MRNRSNSGNHSQKNKSTWTWKSSSAMQCHLWKTSKQLPTDNDDNGIRRKQWQISGRHGWTCMKRRNQVDKIYPFGPLKLYFSLCWICFMKFYWRDRWQSSELHHPISSSNVILQNHWRTFMFMYLCFSHWAMISRIPLVTFPIRCDAITSKQKLFMNGN